MADIQILSSPLNPEECLTYASSDSAGAVNIFIGLVRNQTNGKRVLRLEYEAYVPMAISEMARIAELAIEKFPIEKISIHHRVGVLGVGEAAVVIAVSTPHRKVSFEACEFIIDTLKETVPIWKKEIFEDGEVWVAAHP